MKILQICNKIPYPPHDGGAIAILNISKSLISAGHEVHILAMNTAKHNISVDSIPESITSRIRITLTPVDTHIRPIKLLINFLFSSLPYNATRFDNPVFLSELSLILQHEKYDVVQLEGLYLKPYIPAIRRFHKGIIAYRAHNVESEIWYRLASQSQSILKKYYLHNLAKRVEFYERDLINKYDLLLAITDSDLKAFQHMGNSKPSEVIFTGIPEEDFSQSAGNTNTKDLFFIGALDWIPNQEGLLWFIDKVWAILKNHASKPEFYVAGRNAPAFLERKCRENGILFLGEVDNAHQFMDEHGIMIVPLFAGSGLRIKIVEAMARSKVIITTLIGAQGINLTDGKNIIIAESADDFYMAASSLLTDDQKTDEIKKNAYLFALENFSSNSIINKLIKAYRQNLC